jgi:hypothetical protein
MNSPEMTRGFSAFLKDVQMHKLMSKYRVRMKEKQSIVEPWLLRVTETTTQEDFEIKCASMHTWCERYVELERL